MKNAPNSGSEPAAGAGGVLRFWVCFLVSLAALGMISGLMLVGFFLMMGYHVL